MLKYKDENGNVKKLPQILIGQDIVIDDNLSKSSENPVQNKVILAALEALKTEVILAAHPVGSYWYTSTDENPNTIFGGVWEQIAGKFIFASDDTHEVGSTGGEFTHTLTTDEMPSHQHIVTPRITWDDSTHSTNTLGCDGNVLGIVSGRGSVGVDRNYTPGSSGLAGGGEAHNNMPPYIVANCWHRIG